MNFIPVEVSTLYISSLWIIWAPGFHIDYGTKRHKNEAISIKLWVQEMINLCYKEQGVESDPQTLLDVTDFALITMTSFQSQQLLKFEHDKVCLDGTHRTNSCDFQLYTLIDELMNLVQDAQLHFAFQIGLMKLFSTYYTYFYFNFLKK
jgi:hypothetical protein